KIGFLLVERASRVKEISIEYSEVLKDSTRGSLPDWANIFITVITTGAFMTVYDICKDILDSHTNAEVTLEFEDGSTIQLSNLTRKEAEDAIKKHLNSRSNKNT
ncbi:MAG: hypothetical protein AAGD96_20105, partial [Chloroflexota bacterium]